MTTWEWDHSYRVHTDEEAEKIAATLEYLVQFTSRTDAPPELVGLVHKVQFAVDELRYQIPRVGV